MSDLIKSLNRSYRDYLLKHQEQVIGDFNGLNEFLLDHRCTFKGIPMPTLLKPNFISPEQSEILVANVEIISRALTKFINLYLSDEQVRRIMGFLDRENELFAIEPDYSNPLVISRLDAFLNHTDLKFLEFNCDSPAGIAYSDVLEEGFKKLLNAYPFLNAYHISFTNRQDILIKVLLDCYSEFRERKNNSFPKKPVVAIIDWPDVSTFSEFELHQAHFRHHGIDTVIGAPQDFVIKGNKVYVREREVHLIYKRVITRELIEKWEEVVEFIRAIKEGLVCCCNSFRSYIVGNKKVLAMITDPRFSYIFSKEERDYIDRTIPWTRILADEETLFRGRTVQIKSFVLTNKDILVLKPANMYGGKDVYIGHETDFKTWEDITIRNLVDENWVVQEYVDIPRDAYPEISGLVHFKSKYVNINPFALSGLYAGTITRISDSSVINVSAGGGLVPTLTVY
ncbi:MAG TPA: hypothetical protein ENN61_02795 [Bacteroidaceae bacterium]|mgnify:CR=1 FL=1|nr:hypothetical protein [Bacteroidaceae bacterium]